jgi:hypothetical protein
VQEYREGDEADEDTPMNYMELIMRMWGVSMRMQLLKGTIIVVATKKKFKTTFL